MHIVGLCGLGIYPPAQVHGRTSRYEFHRGGLGRFTITLDEASVTEQWSALMDRLDGKLVVSLGKEPLAAYVIRRCAELQAEGWVLRLIATEFDVPTGRPDHS